MSPKRSIPLFLLFGGALLAFLVLAPAAARAEGPGPGQFWVGSRLGGDGNLGVQNTTNDEYFAVALLYNLEGGGFYNCVGLLVPPHGIEKQTDGVAPTTSGWDSHRGPRTTWELIAVPTETRTWDRSDTQGLGIYAWSKHSPYATRLPASFLAPPTTLTDRLNARACVCEQVQCFEQANNVFGQLGVNCGSVPPLDCDNRQWFTDGSGCPACP